MCNLNQLDKHVHKDYCQNLANGKKCHTDSMCNSGYCNGNNGGGTCEAQKKLGEKCPTTDDNQCEGSYECGKMTYWDSTCEKKHNISLLYVGFLFLSKYFVSSSSFRCVLC